MSSEHQGVLLEEYKGCDEKVSRLDSLIWQTASIIFPLSVVGFGYFGLSSTHTTDQFLILVAVAIGSMTLLITWYLLSRAWYGYQSIAFYRMREIETELGLWHYRYSLFMRKTSEERKIALEGIKNKEEKAQLEKLDSNVRGVSRVGLRVTTAVITGLFLIGWMALLIREYVLTF